jgi:TonB family protein
MPWNRDGKDQKEFRKVLLIVLFFTFLLGVLIPMWKIPVPDRIEVVEIPKRLAKMMLAKKAPPPPPAKVEKKEPKKEEKKDEKKKKEKEVEKKKVEKPKPEKVEQPTPEPVITKRKKVERAGLMAFKDDFADLISDTNDVKLGAAAKISGKGKGNKAKKATRSLVTATSAGGSSGGINTAALSRDAGGGGKEMAGVGFSRVESSIGEGKYAGDDRPLSGDGAVLSRTDEEIQIVFDRYKAALYRIYNRELRKNPTLQGKMVLRLTIEPDGRVSACSVDSSDMDAPTLDEGIAARVKRFKFGAKDGVPTVTILYPIDFLPAS